MPLKDCFVIMPFSDSKSHTEREWTDIFNDLFKQAWEVNGIECYRTNVSRGSITKDIIEKLYSASVVFADLTDSNPNVMYELGLRHTFKKPSIMVKEKGCKIPFDVNDYNVFEYENTATGLRELKAHIKTVIDDIITYPNKSDNPVGDFLHTSDFIIGYNRNKENLVKLEALLNELKYNLKLCNDMIEFLSTSEKNNYLNMKHMFCIQIRNDALVLLMTTRYVEFVDDDWKIIDYINLFCRLFTNVANNVTNIGYLKNDEEAIKSFKKLVKDFKASLENGIEILNTRKNELEEKK